MPGVGNNNNQNNQPDVMDTFKNIFESFNSQFNSTSSSLTKSFDKVTKQLSDLSDALNESTKENKEGNKENRRRRSSTSRGRGHDIEATLDEFNRTLNEDLEKRKKLQEDFLNSYKKTTQSLINFGKTFANQYLKAADRILQSYNNNLQTITTRLGINNQQYAEMIQSSTDQIVNSKLNKQFSSVDYLNETAELLQMGMTQQRAEMMVMNTLISKKVIPNFNASNRSYLQLTKLFGSEFQESINAVGRYATRELGTAGFDQGMFDNLLNDIELFVGIASNGNKDLANQLTSEFAIMNNYLSEDYSSEVASQFSSEINRIMTDGLASNYFSSATGIATREQLIAKIMSGELSNITERWLSLQSSYDRAGGANITKEVEGINTKVAALINSAELSGRSTANFSENLDEYVKKYDAQVERDRLMQELEAGMYETAQEQADKTKENTRVATDFATFFSDKSDDTMELVSSGFDTVNSLLSMILASNAMSSAGGSGLLSKAGGALSKLGGGSKLIGGVKLGLGVGGLAWAASDAVKGYQEGGIGGAVKKGLFGDTSAALGTAEANQNLGLNMAKGAMIGAIAGPIGAGIGAAIGGGLNLLGRLFNSTAKSTEELKKAFNQSVVDYRKSSDEYNEVVEKNRSTQEDLNTVLGGASTGTQEYEDAVNRLSALYPDYIKKTGDVVTVSESQAAIIKSLNDLQEKELALKKEEDKKNLLSSMNDLLKDSGNASFIAETIKDQTNLDLTEDQWSKALSTAGSLDTLSGALKSAGSEAEKTAAINKFIQDTGYTSVNLDQLGVFNKDEAGNITSVSDDAFKKLLDISGIKTEGINVAGLDEIMRTGYVSEYTSSINTINEVFDKFIQGLVTPGVLELQALPEGTGKLKVSDYDTISAQFSAILDYIPEGLQESYKEKYREIVKDYADQFPKFATGLESVPFDNFPALLHQNEMVLTEETANNVRSISNLSNSMDYIVNAIDQQTKEIVSAIGEIYNLLNSMTSISSFKGTNNSGNIIDEGSMLSHMASFSR